MTYYLDPVFLPGGMSVISSNCMSSALDGCGHLSPPFSLSVYKNLHHRHQLPFSWFTFSCNRNGRPTRNVVRLRIFQFFFTRVFQCLPEFSKFDDFDTGRLSLPNAYFVQCHINGVNSSLVVANALLGLWYWICPPALVPLFLPGSRGIDPWY